MIIDHGPEIGHSRLHGPLCNNHGLVLTETINKDCIDVVSGAVVLERSQVGSAVIWRNNQHISIEMRNKSLVYLMNLPTGAQCVQDCVCLYLSLPLPLVQLGLKKTQTCAI